MVALQKEHYKENKELKSQMYDDRCDLNPKRNK